MEGEDTGVDAKKRVSAQHFHIPILEVEGFVRDRGRWVDRNLINGGNRLNRRVEGGFVIRRIGSCEVGERGDADRRRLCGGCDGRFEGCGWFWDGGRFEWGRWGDMRLVICGTKPKGCGDGSCGGVFLVSTGWFGLSSREYARVSENFPTALTQRDHILNGSLKSVSVRCTPFGMQGKRTCVALFSSVCTRDISPTMRPKASSMVCIAVVVRG